MKAIELLKELEQNKCALIPVELLRPVYDAACALKMRVNGGATEFDESGKFCGQYLYID